MKKEEFQKIFGVRYLPSLEVPEGLEREFPYLYRIPFIRREMEENTQKYRQPFEKHLIADVSVREIDAVKGRGLFAERDFTEGEWIAAYTGIVHRYEGENPYALHYPTKFFSMNYYVIDAQEAGNVSRFANHSDDPNMGLIALLKGRILHPALVTIRDVRKGEELVFRYSS